jgi:hypothetical protein
MEETKIVGVPRRFRKQIRHMLPRLTILIEFPWRLHEPLLTASLARLGKLASIIKRHPFAIAALKFRFVVEGINVADATLHEQEDHTFGFGRVMRLAQQTWQGIAGERFSGHRLSRQGSKSAGAASQHHSSIQGHVNSP